MIEYFIFINKQYVKLENTNMILFSTYVLYLYVVYLQACINKSCLCTAQYIKNTRAYYAAAV